MTCPDCGYMMTAFDQECPRCAKVGKPKESAVITPLPIVTPAPSYVPSPYPVAQDASASPMTAVAGAAKAIAVTVYKRVCSPRQDMTAGLSSCNFCRDKRRA